MKMFSTLRYNQENHTVKPNVIARTACTGCRRKKLRCSGGSPCNRCAAKTIECKYAEPLRRGPKSIRISTASASQAIRHAGECSRDGGETLLEDPPACNHELGEAVNLMLAGNATSQSPKQHHELERTDALLDTNQLSLTGSTVLTRNFWPNPDGVKDVYLLGDSISPSPIFENFASAYTSCSSLLNPYQESNPGTLVDYASPWDRSPVSCQCLSSALRLQEALCVAEVGCSLSTLGGLLFIEKHTLIQCSMFLDCPACNSGPHFAMLLIVICQKMATCFNRMLNMLVGWYNRLQMQQGLPPYERAVPVDDLHQVSVKDYKLDLDEEPCVYGALIMIQLKKLQSLLLRMKDTANTWNRCSHITMIHKTEEKVQQQIAIYSK